MKMSPRSTDLRKQRVENWTESVTWIFVCFLPPTNWTLNSWWKLKKGKWKGMRESCLVYCYFWNTVFIRSCPVVYVLYRQLKHWKVRIAHRQWRSNFPRRGRKPLNEKKNWKLRIRKLRILAAKNENRHLEALPLAMADFDCLPERLFLSLRTKSINENFEHWQLRSL